MFNPAQQTFEDGQAAPPGASAAPQVFSRSFSTPAGLPWEQTRAASLEARHGAPLPISDLMHQVKRLDGWSLGRASRFAVFYVRTREFQAPFETLVEVEGRSIKVAFGTAAEQIARARRIAVIAALIAASAVVFGGGALLAMHARQDANDQLSMVEQTLDSKFHAERSAQRRNDQARALVGRVGKARPVGDILADLAWASAAKATDARIVALHWDHGLMAIEARGDTPPFASPNRLVERSSRPIRPGVWLWGVHADPSPTLADSRAAP